MEEHVSNVFPTQTVPLKQQLNAHRMPVFLAQLRINALVFLQHNFAAILWEELVLSVILTLTVPQ